MLLSTTQVEKPWGRDTLPAPFITPANMRVGEIWFANPDAPLALMIKYLFTSAPLSVQVHPNDAQAQARGKAHGKDECWYILDAEPGAQLAIGTQSPLNAAELEAASRDGTIQNHLYWHDAIPGHVYEIPSGTIHAIGAGISLIEVQQNIDLTYRLYDYKSARELHLENGVAVAVSGPYPSHLQYALSPGHIVQRPYYSFAIAENMPVFLPGHGPYYALPINGNIEANGQEARAGECLLIADISGITLQPDSRVLMARAA
jgi:mannose-6-phosphate isomerase